MDSTFPTSSRRTYDIPKPETGLAEWTSKIKALQREVDADEEAEQKRLEEEISAARQARLRRSRGAGAGSRGDSIDMSSTKDQLQNMDRFNDSSSSDIPKSVAERANDQETALRKLMGRNDVYNPDKFASSFSAREQAEQLQPRSLASFIGGSASGPRLNKHAAQQDTHDPTQFVQPDLSTPHPIFGKGGIAMPGMAMKRENKPIIAGSEISERYQPTSVKSTPLKSPSFVANQFAAAPESKKQDSPEPLRRSFTSKDTSSSASLTSGYATTSEHFGGTSSQSRNELSQSTRNTTSSISSFEHVSIEKKDELVFQEPVSSFSKPTGTFRSSTSPAIAKTQPTYSAASYTSKPVPSDNPRNVEMANNGADTPLRRLMETNNVYNPDNLDTPRKTVTERAQSVSLAGFIGGNAKGIRLNKPAPQPDAHDPTQFIQPDTSAPHPIFGRGGIAMPGLASRKGGDPRPNNDNVEHYRPPLASKAVWPPVKTPYADKLQDERSVSLIKVGSRERTLSTPGSHPTVDIDSSQLHNTWSITNTSSYDGGRRSPTKEARSMTPARDRTISTPSKNTAFSTPITTPALARPIQPVPKSASMSPLISTVAVPSPAFQKPTPSKDLTPSISRLQGRGFVQSMVKVSSQLDIPASPTPASADRSRPASATGRKSSVLDRWQPHMQSPSTNSSAPLGNPLRRSTTHEVNSVSNSAQPPTSSTSYVNSTHSLKSVASLPSLAKVVPSPSPKPITEEPAPIHEPYQRSRTPGLGSATTMVLIKPSKSVTDLTQLTHVDELGVKRDSVTSASSKKPLIHPTKERARKPKKPAGPSYPVDQAQQNPTKPNVMNLLTGNKEEPKSAPLPKPLTLDLGTPLPLQTGQLLSSPLLVKFDREKVVSADSIEHREEPFGQIVLPTPRLNSNESTHSKHDAPETSNFFTGPMMMKPKSAPASPVISSFGKLARIPITGSRPTVIEVAQTLIDRTEVNTSRPVEESFQPEITEKPIRPRSLTTQTQAEKRKSAHDRYSAFLLPTLEEEATPTSTPPGMLNRTNAKLRDVKTNIVEETVFVVNEPSLVKPNDGAKITKSETAQLKFEEDPLPNIAVAELLKSPFQIPAPKADVQTISVEILALIGTSATPIIGPVNIFYETEILAVVHRTKSKTTGLASTNIWCWLGRRSILGDREERKLQDLGKRYGTSADIVYQLAEPLELVQVLGGTLAIRQGSRTHWSSENTTMHLVRWLSGVIMIDEVDLSIKNLCSAFSYCVTILGSTYLWHGHGSIAEERAAASAYAKSFSSNSDPLVELLEGESDDDEMFWMIFGDEDFAKADYWKWRKTSSPNTIVPLICRVDFDNTKQNIIPVQFISLDKCSHSSVYVVNCIWELFVLVGREARSNKRAIQFALDTATKISQEVSSSRPYTPTVHVLVFPSRVPLDLRLGIRDVDEAWLNNGEIPDHMNLLSHADATAHLSTGSWGQPALRDHEMLPLGIGLADAS